LLFHAIDSTYPLPFFVSEFTLPLKYSGWTEIQTVTFSADPGKIPYMNIYHEFGHVLDNRLPWIDFYSGTLRNGSVYDEFGHFVLGKDKGVYRRLLDEEVGLAYLKVWDSKRGEAVRAQQDKLAQAGEEWGDMWANYVIDNFNLHHPGGKIRYQWVKDLIVTFPRFGGQG